MKDVFEEILEATPKWARYIIITFLILMVGTAISLLRWTQ